MKRLISILFALVILVGSLNVNTVNATVNKVTAFRSHTTASGDATIKCGVNEVTLKLKKAGIHDWFQWSGNVRFDAPETGTYEVTVYGINSKDVKNPIAEMYVIFDGHLSDDEEDTDYTVLTGNCRGVEYSHIGLAKKKWINQSVDIRDKCKELGVVDKMVYTVKLWKDDELTFNCFHTYSASKNKYNLKDSYKKMTYRIKIEKIK